MRIDLPLIGTVENSVGWLVYGQINFITDSGMMVVLVSWRKKEGWEQVYPPREMLAVGGRFVSERPPGVTDR